MSSSDEDYDDSCGDDSDMEIDWQKVGMVRPGPSGLCFNVNGMKLTTSSCEQVVGGVVCGLLLVGGIVAL